MIMSGQREDGMPAARGCGAGTREVTPERTMEVTAQPPVPTGDGPSTWPFGGKGHVVGRLRRKQKEGRETNPRGREGERWRVSTPRALPSSLRTLTRDRRGRK